MLEVNTVSVSYGKSRIVNNVSFAVDCSEKLAILGRNGVGKTTLLKSLIGLLPMQTGTVRLGEVNLTSLKAYERACQGIAYVPQGREILPNLTVRENLELGRCPIPGRSRNAWTKFLITFPFCRNICIERAESCLVDSNNN
jgi:urea transport system ATP-binding protein